MSAENDVPNASLTSSTGYSGTRKNTSALGSLEAIDLTVSHGTPQQDLPTLTRYWRTRPVRRGKPTRKANTDGTVAEVDSWNPTQQYTPQHTAAEKDFTYISGPRYFFQRFVRQYPVGALCVWMLLFLVELAMVVLYLVQSTRSYDVNWVTYDQKVHSGWFYAFFVLSLVSLLQLFFAYSLSIMTLFVVVSTSVYQIVLFFVSIAPSLAWVSQMYVPLFLRCWPLRQYFLFILDSVAVMSKRNRKLDLIRLAAGPISLFVCMVFSAAEIFRIDQTFQGHPMNVIVSIYFVIVTVSTVGFGDVTPSTPEGKTITIVIIFIFVAKMPTFIQVMRSTAKILKALRSYRGRKNHFIVYGRVTREDIISLLDEVFCLYPMKAVCFCNKDFPADVLAIGRHPTYRLRCTFLLMSTLDASSLKRMKADSAAGVIIFPIREGYSSRVDDDVMLSSLIFERLMPTLPQYVWLRYGLHAKLLRGQRAAVIDEHLKKNLMASALLLPGVVPFLVNLVRTAWAEGEEPADLWTDAGIYDWRHLYEYSRRNVITTCPVPERFIGSTLRTVVSKFKYHDVMIVGMEQFAQRVVRLDLNVILTEGDVLLAIYERQRNGLVTALEFFAQSSSLDDSRNDEGYGTHFRQGINENELLRRNINASIVFYPYNNSTTDLCEMNEESQQERLAPKGAHAAGTVMQRSEEDLRDELGRLPWSLKTPGGVPLTSLTIGAAGAERLSKLLSIYESAAAAAKRTGAQDGLVRDSQTAINALLLQLAEEQATELARCPSSEDVSNNEEVFLFVDQTTSIIRQTNTSIYEDVISQTIAQYQLYMMMECIRSIHAQSRLTLLTLRKHPVDFLKTWRETFGVPLRYIRGQGSLDSHLNYALTADTDISKVRGILLYCSQMGARDFGDVPIFSVENSVRELIEWSERSRDGDEDIPEQNIVVELQSFTSCIKVSPFHTDAEWRSRGERNFQDSLAFMIGRCFSSNMVQTLMIHSHRDTRIVSFFEMVLNLISTAEMFDLSVWCNRPNQSQTLLKLCSNHALQFKTFGDAFEFLLAKRSCVAIGVFRLFPRAEMLPGNPRFFVTNPPLAMPLLVDDIVYCLDGSGGTTES